MRILFLDLDTLRPDHLGCYGYHRNTSPNLDRIAADGVRFEEYYCSDAPCLPSRSALWSGRFGIQTGVVNHGGTTADMRLEGPARDVRDRMGLRGLAAVLGENNRFHTASISPFASRHGAWWFHAGFRETHDTGMEGMESAEDVTPTVLRWIEANAKRDNWFLHVNYWDAHKPYRVPMEFGNPFENDPLPAWLTEEVIAQHQTGTGPHSAHEMRLWTGGQNPRYPRNPGEAHDLGGMRRVIDGYDCGIAYMDQHIGRLFDALAAQGVMDDLVVIISADHGENLGELGIYGEHGTADRLTHRIPMIIRWPGAPAGHVDRAMHYNLDLPPTLTDLLGIAAPKDWQGNSYAETLRSGAVCGRDALVLSQCTHVCQRSVRFGPWLYMRTIHDGYRLFPDEMLFNVENDPHEQHNLAVERPDICGEGARRLLDWQIDQMKQSSSDVDPLWTVVREGGPFLVRGRLAAYAKRLEETGRGWAVEELRRRHPYEPR